ncbi:MAG: hypothetical protein IKI31_04645 [Treponema sp.]|nr:hypothetical protein [Treponema sp.]
MLFDRRVPLDATQSACKHKSCILKRNPDVRIFQCSCRTHNCIH